jgi:hypothetical protein
LVRHLSSILIIPPNSCAEQPCGGRRTRTVMADLATRPLERRRPVPTGNVLQTQPTQLQYSSRFSRAQFHESSYSTWRPGSFISGKTGRDVASKSEN